MAIYSFLLRVILMFTVYQVVLTQSQRSPAYGNQHGQQMAQERVDQVLTQSGQTDQGPNSTNKSPADMGYTHYTYRGNGMTGAGSSSYHNGYPSTPVGNFVRDVYGTRRDADGNPIFGLSSNADFQMSAYFGQIFWGFVALTTTIVMSVWIIRFFVGTDFKGIVDKIKDTSAKAKSMDLDRLTNMVYQAFDTYGKWAAKEVRQISEIGKSKGM